MRRVLSEKWVVQSFRCLPQLGLAYLTNPKTASTTINYSMIAAAAARTGAEIETIEPHRRDVGPFIEDIFQHPLFGSPAIRQMTVFSLVRNPFARALSGYVSKIASARKPEWRAFAAQFAIRPDIGRRPVSFTEFLRLIATQPDECVNAHFRPQYLNLLLPFSRPHFVGRLEQFDETMRFLEGAGVAIVERKGRNTSKVDRIAEHFTEEAEALVARKFAKDFELFGYSPKLADLRELGAQNWNNGAPDLLLDWLSGGKFPLEHLDAQARVHRAIDTADDVEDKVAGIREACESDSDWRRLQRYAKIARSAQRANLLRRLEKQIATLRDVHRACVDDRDIFLPLKPQNDRRSEPRMRKAKADGATQDG